MTHAVEPCFVIEIHGVGDQDVSLPMPNRVSHPRGAESGVMRAAICKNLMPDGVVLEKHDDFAVRLHDLHGEGMKINSWQAGRNTGVVERVVRFRGDTGEVRRKTWWLCIAPRPSRSWAAPP